MNTKKENYIVKISHPSRLKRNLLILMALSSIFLSSTMCTGAKKTDTAQKDYAFDTFITRPVLENYLNRSITIQNLLLGQGNFDDNLRMIRNIGAKFIGRSITKWGQEASLLKNLDIAKDLAAKVHAQDKDIVLQACIFEIVTPEVNQITIPAWAFKALGMPIEKRNFRYENMIYPDGQFKDHWGFGSVPDVSQLETKLWFYFQAISYINAGIEAIHFGQVELMNKNDKNLDNYTQILSLIRNYALKNSRRHMLLCDSHVPSGGFLHEDKLLMDFHSFPLRIKEVSDKPQQAILELGFSDGIYKRSKGGITYSGWKCESLPYLVEIDNWGAGDSPGQPKKDPNSIWVWGYDEITWFALQNKAYRQSWLSYAWDWVKKIDPNAHLEMPGGRTVSATGQNKEWYYANNPSEAFPQGYGDEDVIKALWEKD
jgi:hypothetical protein